MADGTHASFWIERTGDDLGKGGIGHVDKVRVVISHSSSMPVGSEWARKRLHPKWNSDPTARARFAREVELLRAMSHPHIITCAGVNLPGEEAWYLMPLYSSNLRLFIVKGSHTGNWRFFAQHGAVLADALQYAHDFPFFHRDLKPENILFNHRGPLVIADWGLGDFVHQHSKVLTQLTRGGMGTEYYCSLEQWSSGKCDQRGDIYSLGMTLDECVTGRQRRIKPGDGVTGPTTMETTPGARYFNEIVRAMTMQVAFQRPSSMASVAEALRAAAAL